MVEKGEGKLSNVSFFILVAIIIIHFPFRAFQSSLKAYFGDHPLIDIFSLYVKDFYSLERYFVYGFNSSIIIFSQSDQTGSCKII